MLMSRRDGLRAEANRYYDLLSGQVQIHATNEDEVLEIVRVDDRFVDVSIREDSEGADVYFQRRFDAGETREVRIGMWGGADRVIVTRAGNADITLRIVGGGGDRGSGGVGNDRAHSYKPDPTSECFWALAIPGPATGSASVPFPLRSL